MSFVKRLTNPPPTNTPLHVSKITSVPVGRDSFRKRVFFLGGLDPSAFSPFQLSIFLGEHLRRAITIAACCPVFISRSAQLYGHVHSMKSISVSFSREVRHVCWHTVENSSSNYGEQDVTSESFYAVPSGTGGRCFRYFSLSRRFLPRPRRVG